MESNARSKNDSNLLRPAGYYFILCLGLALPSRERDCRDKRYMNRRLPNFWVLDKYDSASVALKKPPGNPPLRNPSQY